MSGCLVTLDKLKKIKPVRLSLTEIESKKDEFLNAIKICEEYLLNNDTAAAIAAPQLGFDLHLFVTHLKQKDKRVLKNYINTEILYKKTLQHGNEGCMSCAGFYFSIPRFVKINENHYHFNHKNELKLYTGDHSGFSARVIQHELDHLDGLTVLDRAYPIAKPVMAHTPLYRVFETESEPLIIDYNIEGSEEFLYNTSIDKQKMTKILIGAKYE